jgi:hypothetical protein
MEYYQTFMQYRPGYYVVLSNFHAIPQGFHEVRLLYIYAVPPGFHAVLFHTYSITKISYSTVRHSCSTAKLGCLNCSLYIIQYGQSSQQYCPEANCHRYSKAATITSKLSCSTLKYTASTKLSSRSSVHVWTLQAFMKETICSEIQKKLTK